MRLIHHAAISVMAFGISYGAIAGSPAARLGDGVVCPMVTGLVPHVGGPIIPPGATNVLIGGLPAAYAGSMTAEVGPPGVLIGGSSSVLISGKRAARLGDMTSHGGTVITGFPTVLIGN